MRVDINFNNHVSELILNAPPVNALNSSEWHELADTFQEISANKEVHAVIIRAIGKGFCAGVDIKELQQDPDKITDVNAGCWRVAEAIHHCSVPVISACHGFVLGGGILISGASDIVLATEDAFFGLPEIDRGALGGGAHLSRLFPLQAVRKMMFTGKPISAEMAFSYGALESIHANQEDLNTAALNIARDIASKSPIAVRLAKQALNEIEPTDVNAEYKKEQGYTLKLYQSSDSQEARDAFVEKRDADFKNEA